MNVIPGPAGVNGPPQPVFAIGGILTSLLLLLGLPALYAALAKQAKVLSLMGIIGAAIVFLTFVTLYSITLPALLANSVTAQSNAGSPPPAILALLLTINVAGLIALITLGIAVLRTNVFSKFIGVLFLIALLNVLGFVLQAAPVLILAIVGIIGTLALDGAWFFSGLTLVRREAVVEVTAEESAAS
jgi:hypothetical protein